MSYTYNIIYLYIYIHISQLRILFIIGATRGGSLGLRDSGDVALSNFDKRKDKLEKARIDKFELDEGLKPYRPNKI